MEVTLAQSATEQDSSIIRIFTMMQLWVGPVDIQLAAVVLVVVASEALSNTIFVRPARGQGSDKKCQARMGTLCFTRASHRLYCQNRRYVGKRYLQIVKGDDRMNSQLLRNKLRDFFKPLNMKQRETLLVYGLAYQSAIRSGNTNMKVAYEDFLNVILEYQKLTNVTIIESPDQSYYNALNALSAICVEDEKRRSPEKGTKSFSSVESAHEWLSSNLTIVPTSLHTSCESTLGLFANHSRATGITIEYIDYKRQTGVQYGICEQEYTRILVKANVESLKEQWEFSNPGLTIVLVTYSSNVRGDMTSLAFGFGDRVEHVKLFIIYKKIVDQNKHNYFDGLEKHKEQVKREQEAKRKQIEKEKQKQILEELAKKELSGDATSKEKFILAIKEALSMKTVREMWQLYPDLAVEYPDVDAKIKGFLLSERSYGHRVANTERQKSEIIKMLTE